MSDRQEIDARLSRMDAAKLRTTPPTVSEAMTDQVREDPAPLLCARRRVEATLHQINGHWWNKRIRPHAEDLRLVLDASTRPQPVVAGEVGIETDLLKNPRLAWHIPDNLRWLADQPGLPRRVPEGSLTGVMLIAAAERLEKLSAEIVALGSGNAQ